MATDNANGFKFHSCLYGGAAPIYKALLASSTAITTGDMLRGSAGYADLSNISATDALLGVSKSVKTSAQSNANPEITFVPALPGVLFSGNDSGTPTQALIWTKCDIEGTTGIMEVNSDASSVECILLTALKEDESTFAANSNLVFQVVTSVWSQTAPA